MGYFTSEIWESVPPAVHESYVLGHSASERHIDTGTVLYISSFAIHTETQRGLGKGFFLSSILCIQQTHPSLTRIVFIVHDRWLAARHIYETAGFEYTGTIKNFFSAGPNDSADLIGTRDAWIMEKNL